MRKVLASAHPHSIAEAIVLFTGRSTRNIQLRPSLTPIRGLCMQATISEAEQRRLSVEAICDFIEKKVAGRSSQS